MKIRSLIIFFVFFCQLVFSESLIKNSNFIKNLNFWSSSNDNLVDVQTLKFFVDENTKKNFLGFDLSKKGNHQGIFQSIFNLKSIQNPILISLEYLIKSNKKKLKGNFYSYVQIKYSDSTIKNIWLKPLKGFKENEFQKNCIFIPYTKSIENTLISLGGNPFFENFKNEKIEIKSLNIEQLDLNVNFSTFVSKNPLKCSKIKISKNIVESLKIKENFLKSDLKVEKNDLTIVTHLTIDRLNFLIENSKSFKGPISASIFIKNPNELIKLMETYSNVFELRKYVTIHLIFRNKKNKIPFIYPTNLMRNIARKNSKTFFILSIDVSFIVNENLFKDTNNNKLINIFKKFPSKFKTLLILPCYHQLNKERPKEKKEIKIFLENKKIKKFEQYSHKISNFEEWENDAKEYYNVNSKFSYSEPFYISTKEEPL